MDSPAIHYGAAPATPCRPSATSRSATAGPSAAPSPTRTRRRTCRRRCSRSTRRSCSSRRAGRGPSRRTGSSRARSTTAMRHDELLTHDPAARAARQRRVRVRLARAARVGLRDGRRRRRSSIVGPGDVIEWAGIGVTGVSDHPYRGDGRRGGARRHQGLGRRHRGGRGARPSAAASVNCGHPRLGRVPLGDGGRVHAAGDRRRRWPAWAERATPRRRGPAGVRLERIVPGRRPSADLRGAVLARDLRVGGARWSKGRRLDAADLDALAAADPARSASTP